MFTSIVVLSLMLLGQIPPQTEPIVFCGTQALPVASTYQVIVDNAAPAPLTMDATKDAMCTAADTHSFRLPAAQFPVGAHTVQVRGTNTFGSTLGPVFNVTVGIAPGTFTITGVKGK